ncbi:hypothetical protein TURU_058500 [Turdus rufiventris]|nr:hypothetical protein TURU_058500 [Turdus rufiventris]
MADTAKHQESKYYCRAGDGAQFKCKQVKLHPNQELCLLFPGGFSAKCVFQRHYLQPRLANLLEDTAASKEGQPARVIDESRIDVSSNLPELPDLNSVMIERSTRCRKVLKWASDKHEKNDEKENEVSGLYHGLAGDGAGEIPHLFPRAPDVQASQSSSGGACPAPGQNLAGTKDRQSQEPRMDRVPESSHS